ncbi:uncharacterized protein TM35_001091080 [Trypanosoma theileri]|uniref:CCDC81 HU domain-containing protein n=1 Tax=Trypanosoma theileri TaxID=67003 RepID=A0A1X0NFH5_9TRYP|nr:uncharacterized protein TM35_001091080 [Trypanosoma theileri]ORC81685.1 hypothetical protein TM35_001091080 [Trypanosoma theileri]
MSCDPCYACYAEIADIVVNTKSLYRHQNKNGGTDLLHRIWRVMGEMLIEQMVNKRSCIVPDFFHASIKSQKIEFYNGMKTFYKPQLVLLPDFLSKYHVQNVLTMHDAHYHATVPEMISYATIAALVGTDRFTVEAAICDSIREIGKYLGRNPTTVLRIDIGIAFLEFRGREYRIKWSENFLKRFRAVVGPQSLVSPYDPPPIASKATGCRFQTGCLSKDDLNASVANTVEDEKRLTLVEMNDSKGGSGFKKSFW